MSTQALKATAAVLNAALIPLGDIGVEVDDFGVETGGVRVGTSSVLGGLIINGAVGAGGVSSVNGQVGAASLSLDNLNNVTAPAPTTGQSLVWNGTAWVNSSVATSLAALSDTAFTGVVAGNILVYDGPTAKWVNRAPTALGSGGASDNLGNHTATQPLNMSGFDVSQALGLTFTRGWRLSDTPVDTLVIYKTVGASQTPIWSLKHTGIEGAGFVAFKDYSSARPDDTGAVSISNLLYFDAPGALRKANFVANPNALKGISAGLFGGLVFTGATTGQVLTYNGTSFAPATPSGGGGGVTSFQGLTDTPASPAMASEALSLVRVNAGGTALEYVANTFAFAALTEAVAAAPHAENDTILYKAGAWGIFPSTSNNLQDLDDVTGTAPTDGQALIWDAVGTQFVYIDCLKTAFVTPANGDLMYFNGTAWINIPPGANGNFLKMVGGIPAWSA